MSTEKFDLVVLGGGIVGLWTARAAARAGARVGVVEIGPRMLAEQRDATPSLRFSARTNVGSLRARNHIFTGNSSYWGGGLVRNPPAALAVLFGAEVGPRVAAEYPSIETALGVREGFEPAPLAVLGRPLHEVAVLPGKLRGLWADFRDPGVTCFTGAAITDVGLATDGVSHVTIGSADGERRLTAPEYSLSMGVIDSNLFVQRWLTDAVPASLRSALGTRLHDHWSVPIGAMPWRACPTLEPLFPPKFRSGVVAGRRVALPDGFFHIVADLDKTPPYDRVKEFLRVRQQGRGALPVIKAAFATMGSPFGMLRAGIHYLAKHELHIGDGTEVRLVIDFESSRDPSNRVFATGVGPTLDWDLRDDDRRYFESALRTNRDWWESVWREAGVDARWLVEDWSTAGMSRYLDTNAVDAYHLGGGLHPDSDEGSGVTERNGRMRGCPNVFVNGTAFFGRPGPANPVLTLLARASVYVDDIVKGGAPS